MSKHDRQQWSHIIEPAANDRASQMVFTVSDNGRVVNTFVFNSHDANVAKKAIDRQIEAENAAENNVHRRNVMNWYQTRFDAQSHTGDKAVIEDISKKAAKVIFENGAVKSAILRGDPRFNKPWNELAYLVAVKVQTINGIPKLYEIIDYHPAHTFDPADKVTMPLLM
jgi:hypothetical protein